jgi:CRP/FNR family transcriptional regulator
MDTSIPLTPHLQVTCTNCALRNSCLPSGLSQRELQCAESMVATRVRLRRGASLYRCGDAFKSLYAVWLGSLKSTACSKGAGEQVVGFHMTGEKVGFDGLAAGRHTCDVVALEDTELCVLPFSRIEETTASIPALRQHLCKSMSRTIVVQHGLMLALGTMHAHQRLAVFLVDLADRFEARGYSGREFVLRMTRADLGSFLGLQLETVSRAMSQFARDGLIDLRNAKQVRLIEPGKLRKIAAGCDATKHEGAERAPDPCPRAPRPVPAASAARAPWIEEFA